MLHLKDFYTDHITSLTVQNCPDIRVVIDCPILQRNSPLQRFKVKNCNKLEFISLTSTSLVQTPSEVVIENVREVVSLPNKIFKSPNSNTEKKCLGANTLRGVKIMNSKINIIKTKAFFNVTGIKSIEFENVTIGTIQTQAIEAIMNIDNTVFKIVNSNIQDIEAKGIVVQSGSVHLQKNMFSELPTNSINITSEYLGLTENRIKQINANALVIKSVNTEIYRNDISLLKTNALNSVKCIRKRTGKKHFNFVDNKVATVEPNSLYFDHNSCKSSGATISFTNNKIDCRCRNVAFLNTASDLNAIIMNVSNNNTCLSAPCTLPVDIVKLLLESDMCQIELDPQVTCLLYNDKHSTNEATTDEDVTEPAPTFYLIRPANSPNGIAAMTAVNKDDLLRDSRLNMTNRTAIKVVFDSSKDFVETLRSTSSSRKRPVEEPKTPSREEYVNRCVGPHCRNNVAYDRQKALDFYKYVYAQLRPPRQNEKKKKT